MDKPYHELARLVGNVLAARWLNKCSEHDELPITHSTQDVSDISEADQNNTSGSDNVIDWNG